MSDILQMHIDSNYGLISTLNDLAINEAYNSVYWTLQDSWRDSMYRTLLKDYDSSTSTVVNPVNRINNTANTVVYGTSKNDTLINHAEGATINSDSGADLIDNDANCILIRSGSGNDSINLNGSSSVTVDGSSGDDEIVGTGKKRLYRYTNGDGNDTIIGYDETDTLELYNESYYTTIVSDNDLIVSIGLGSITLKDAATKTLNLNGGVEDVEVNVINETPYANLRGASKNDTLINYAGGATLNGGSGDDLIYSGTTSDHTINNFYGQVTINGGDGADTIVSADDPFVLINGGNGQDEIYVTGMLVDVYGDGGDDFIINEGRFDLVNGGDDDDTIINYAGGSTLEGGSGNDSIIVSTAVEHTIGNSHGYVTVEGGSGYDTIDSYDPYVLLNGDGGDDSINVHGWNDVTIDGGSGINTIIGLGKRNVINYSPGRQIIFGYDDNDSLNLYGSYYTTLLSDGDMIVNVSHAGNNIILKEASDKTLNIIDGKYGVYWANGGKDTNVYGSDGNDHLRNSAGGVRMYGYDGDDYIYSNVTRTYRVYVGNWSFAERYGYVTIGGGAGNDTIYNDDGWVSIDGGDGDDSIYSYERYEVTIRGGKGNDTISWGSGGYTSRKSFTYVEGDGNDIITGSWGSNDNFFIYSDEGYTSLRSASGDKIIRVGAGSITIDGALSTNIIGSAYVSTNTIEGTKGNNILHNSDIYAIVNANAGNDTINNEGNYAILNGGAGNDLIRTSKVSTLNGGAGNDTLNLTSQSNIIEYAAGDGKDIVIGYDETDTIDIIDGSNYLTLKSGSDMIVSIGSGTMTLKNAYNKTLNIIGGEYDTVNNTVTNSTVVGTVARDILFNRAGGAVINAGKGNDVILSQIDSDCTINNQYGLVTLDGGEGNDQIINANAFVSISGGAGNDFLYNFGGVSTLNGYSGNDIISNEGGYSLLDAGTGNDVIADNGVFNTIKGGTGSDTIFTTGERSTLSGGSGNDLIMNLGEKQTFLFGASDGNDSIRGFGISDSLKITSGSIKSVSISGLNYVIDVKGSKYAGMVTLFGSAIHPIKKVGSTIALESGKRFNNSTKNVSLVGSSGNDSIVNTGKNVTIDGGAGNDTIVGSNYAEMILMSESGGNDVIKNFGVNDTLITTNSTLQSTKISGTSYVLTIEGDKSSSVVTLEGTASNVLKVNGSNVQLTNGKRIVNKASDSYADSIISSGSRVTLQAGKGADTITGSDYAEQYWFSYASGNDVVTNFGLNDTIKNTSGTMSYKTVGDDVIVSIKKSATVGTVTLEGAAQYDFRKSGAYLTAINRIENKKNKVKVTGTTDDDHIINYSSKVTIQAGKGDDTITGSDYAEQYWFSYASGNDVVTNFGVNDTLKCTSGTMTLKKSGKDYVVTIKKSGQTAVGTITLQGAAENYTLKKSGSYITAKANTNSNAQMPSDDYWFIDEQNDADQLSEILPLENISVGLEEQFDLKNMLKTNELTYSARHRLKK